MMVHRIKNDPTSLYFEKEYATEGLDAQRRYPNEELCRFMGRNFFQISKEKRKNIKILEAGCGTGANLWMIAREGFDAIGLDTSLEGINLCKRMLETYGCTARLFHADMTALPVGSESLDAIVDVFSSYCLNQDQGEQFLSSAHTCLKSGGLFFSYFPSKGSSTWKIEKQNTKSKNSMIDENTFNGLRRKGGPYSSLKYPFRFLAPDEYISYLEIIGFEVKYCEVVGKTYRRLEEYFEFVVIEATKK